MQQQSVLRLYPSCLFTKKRQKNYLHNYNVHELGYSYSKIIIINGEDSIQGLLE